MQPSPTKRLAFASTHRDADGVTGILGRNQLWKRFHPGVLSDRIRYADVGLNSHQAKLIVKIAQWLAFSIA